MDDTLAAEPILRDMSNVGWIVHASASAGTRSSLLQSCSPSDIRHG
jgi:hypothetical protein